MSAQKSHVFSPTQPKPSPEEMAFYLSNIDLNFKMEKDAFLRLRDKLAPLSKDRFVAISEGKIIDEDSDELKLAKRVSCLPDDLFILIKRVLADSRK